MARADPELISPQGLPLACFTGVEGRTESGALGLFRHWRPWGRWRFTASGLAQALEVAAADSA